MNGISLIWDIDGTLIDSYPAIVSALTQTLLSHGISWDPLEIERFVKQYSINEFFRSMTQGTGFDAPALQKEYGELVHKTDIYSKPMKNAIELLKSTKDKGIEHYIITHRSETTFDILRNNHMDDYFKEVITNNNGFARKPDPTSILYLVSKYDLNKERTFYVGDRSLDMQAANNAEIPGILYLPNPEMDISTEEADYIVDDLIDIEEILDMLD